MTVVSATVVVGGGGSVGTKHPQRWGGNLAKRCTQYLRRVPEPSATISSTCDTWTGAAVLLAPPRILSLWFITLERDLVPERGLDLELALDPERGPEGDSELGPGLGPDRNTG